MFYKGEGWHGEKFNRLCFKPDIRIRQFITFLSISISDHILLTEALSINVLFEIIAFFGRSVAK